MKNVTAVEIVLSYVSLGWAYVLFTSPLLFESSDNWNQVQQIMPYEWLVGSVALIAAVTKIIGLILKNKRIRWIGLIMSAIFWITIAAGMLIAKGYLDFTTGFVVYSGMAILSLWTSKEVMLDGRTD
ncbi:ammonia permease [Solibacillus silvestris StLB046]|uniref:Ammonia permease n=1 Tax=Solibacillus silvestris (strain StLB046) TaxID=1002809 RepID=F2F2M9_SOLSS|nr:hypothetical protein [Solibacillus silvestris]BAK15867.1 ammonia permease [Solibacillus silvestris StLB046]